jgi:hypothetical protein
MTTSVDCWGIDVESLSGVMNVSEAAKEKSKELRWIILLPISVSSSSYRQ